MKVGIDVRCLAQGKNTGVEGYAKNQLIALFESDSKSEFVLFFNAWKGKCVDFSWIEKYSNVSLNSFSFPNKLLNLSLWLLQYPKIDLLCGGVDYFFMPNNNFIALSKKTKLLLTIHDLSFVDYKASFSLKRRLWHFFVNPRQLIYRAHKIIAISESTKESVLDASSVSKNTVLVAKNGLTAIRGMLNRNDMELITVKEKYELPYNFMLFFGTIEPRKNIIGIIIAFEEFLVRNPKSDFYLVLAGATGWKSRGIYTKIEQSQFRDRIRVISDVPEGEKEALYTLASFFVYPSFYEGFGFPPLEALMCSVPSIVSHTTSLPEVVGKYAVLVDPFRTDEMVVAFEDLTKKASSREHIANNESMRFARQFRWQKSTDLLRSIIHS